MASNFYSLCNPIIVGCKLYQNNTATIPSIDGFYSNGTDCYQVSGGAGNVSAISVCPPVSYLHTVTSGTTAESACNAVIRIIADSIFSFEAQGSVWGNVKALTASTSETTFGTGPIDSALISGDYYINRMIPIFDTSQVTYLPSNGFLSFYITENNSLVPLTYYLIASDVVNGVGKILTNSDWDNFSGSTDGSAVPLSSVVVGAGQVGRIRFVLNATALNLIYSISNFSAYIISSDDKNNTPPLGNPSVPKVSFDRYFGLSGGGDCVLTLFNNII